VVFWSGGGGAWGLQGRKDETHWNMMLMGGNCLHRTLESTEYNR